MYNCRFYFFAPSDSEKEEMLVMNSTSTGPLDPLVSNTTSVLTEGVKESFSSILTKNIVAMLVWLVLSIINGSMVHTFQRHRYSEPQGYTKTY